MKAVKEGKTRIIVDGVELTVSQTGSSVSVRRVVGRDRERRLDIWSGIQFSLDHDPDPAVIILVRKMKQVAALQTASCTCDYRYGHSDHAVLCRSIYVALLDGACADDD